MGVLFDGKLDAKDIASGIVYLAEQGHIHIKSIDRKVFFFFDVDDFELRLKKLPEGKRNHLKLFYSNLFLEIHQP